MHNLVNTLVQTIKSLLYVLTVSENLKFGMPIIFFWALLGSTTLNLFLGRQLTRLAFRISKCIDVKIVSVVAPIIHLHCFVLCDLEM